MLLQIYSVSIDLLISIIKIPNTEEPWCIDLRCFPLCQRFRKFRSEFKWKGSFRFLLTGIFGITSGGGPHISVGIFWPKFAIPFQAGSLPLLRNSVTKFKMTRAISIGCPDLIGKCRPIFLRYSHWSLTGHFGIMESSPENSFGPKLSR